MHVLIQPLEMSLNKDKAFQVVGCISNGKLEGVILKTFINILRAASEYVTVMRKHHLSTGPPSKTKLVCENSMFGEIALSSSHVCLQEPEFYK